MNSLLTSAVRKFLKAEITNRHLETATLYTAVQSLLGASQNLLEIWFDGQVEESITDITELVLRVGPEIELVHLLDGEYFESNTDRRIT